MLAWAQWPVQGCRAGGGWSCRGHLEGRKPLEVSWPGQMPERVSRGAALALRGTSRPTLGSVAQPRNLLCGLGKVGDLSGLQEAGKNPSNQ